MNFDFFEKLTTREAEEYLNDFLNFGRKAHKQMLPAATAEGIEANMSVQSVVPVLSWLLGQCRTLPKRADPLVPEWIRNTEIYAKSLFDFDENSTAVIMYGAFYLGECLVLYDKQLGWSTGNPDVAEKNMPVVHGFRVTDLAPILIVENLFGRISRDPTKIGDIATAVEIWLSRAPSSE